MTLGLRSIRSGALLWLVSVLLVAVGCSTNAATGEQQLNALSLDQEIALGKQAAPQFLEQLGGEIDSKEIRQYVSEVGQKLAAVSERSHLPWKFKVVDSEVLNAFALPGGSIFISRGFLEKLRDESMLAAVLAHEIGHTTAQHLGQRITRQQLVGMIGGIARSTAGNSAGQWLRVGTDIGGGLLLMSYSREQELESDYLSFRYVAKLGYSPKGVLNVLRVLEQEAKGPPRSSIFSTHPAPAERARRAARYIARIFPDADDTDRYTTNATRYDQIVLQNLQKLPSPRHGASS